LTSATLLVRVVPWAGRTALAGRRGDALLIRLAAAPVDGAANEALIEAVADFLSVPRSAVAIVSGSKHRDKRLRVEGLTPAELQRRVSALVEGPPV
jgi:uncharacterized protein YggU (UPF0235/DUF167 family)